LGHTAAPAIFLKQEAPLKRGALLIFRTCNAAVAGSRI
jgi:hypothetical protein